MLNCLSIKDLLLFMSRHESKFIQDIIKDVLNKLDPKYINVSTHIVGIDPLVHTISDFISTATDDVRLVGIHGMPGIGKTTIAKVVFNQLCYGFEGSCFLSNINETSEQSNGLVLLQKQLLHDILKQNPANINNVDRGMVLIKERLCHKRVLVVVDDVTHQYQLNALVGDGSWFGPGSRVIITSEDERLLLKVNRKCHVKELKRDASLQLFSWHAFRETKPAKDYVEVSNDVVDYCGGLPLALEVLGSCLSGKNKSRWKCIIDKLRKIPNHDIQEKLRISFDKLDDHKLQNTFLDLASFFIGRNKEYVAKVLEARCGYNPEDDLGTLSERSLINVNASGNISMHNLLRDMGREIIHKESPNNPGKRSRVWQCEDAWNVLSKQMVITKCIHKCLFIFLFKLLAYNYFVTLLNFVGFLGNGSGRGFSAGCQSIRKEFIKHRIIYKDEMLEVTPNQWSTSIWALQTAF